MTAPGIPFYVHPAADPVAWRALGERFAGAEGPRDGFAVLNIANGPGDADEAYYPDAIAGLRAAAPGLHLVGYVDAAYGERPDSALAAEVGAWAARYAITGIMLDQLPSGLPGAVGTASRARELIARVRSAGATWVAGNPGTDVHPRITARLDVVCVHEQAGSVPAPAFTTRRRKRWVLVHSVRSQQRRYVEKICAGAGYAWASMATLPQPWDGSGWCPGAQAGTR